MSLGTVFLRGLNRCFMCVSVVNVFIAQSGEEFGFILE